MRENRPYGSEGGGIELNRSFLPLSFFDQRAVSSRHCKLVGTFHVPYTMPLAAKIAKLRQKSPDRYSGEMNERIETHPSN